MELPKRKPIRLKEYDYSQNGAYFVTICTNNRACLLGEIVNTKMNLFVYGEIALKHIQILSNLYKEIRIDKYAIMPNHIHMIITIRRECIACIPPTDKTKMLIPKIIQTFKSSVTKEIRRLGQRHACNACPTVWQSRYYEHVIRDEKSYQEIWQYIDNNVLSWKEDKLHPNM